MHKDELTENLRIVVFKFLIKWDDAILIKARTSQKEDDLIEEFLETLLLIVKSQANAHP